MDARGDSRVMVVVCLATSQLHSAPVRQLPLSQDPRRTEKSATPGSRFVVAISRQVAVSDLARSLVAAQAGVDHLHHQREGHGEVDVTLGNVQISPSAISATPTRIRKEGQHLDGGVGIDRSRQ